MTNSFIRIKAGAYRTTDVSGQVFQLVEQFKQTAKGNYVTVKNGGRFPGFPEDIRVKVDAMSDYEFVSEQEFIESGNTPVTATEVAESGETDEEVIARIRQRFEILDEMTTAATSGDIRAMIVSGPPGVGKSFGVEKVLGYHDLFATIANDSSLKKYEIVKGAIGELGMYQKLYEYRHKKNVVVFDDCDAVLKDPVALNLLKGALDSGKKRKISWLSESRILRDEGIPNSFSTTIFIHCTFDLIGGSCYSKQKVSIKSHLFLTSPIK